MLRRLVVVVQVVAHLARSGFAKLPEQALQLVKQIRFRTEMTQTQAVCFPFGRYLLHSLAVVAMKAVSLNDRRLDFLAPENMLESALDRSRARTGRTRDGDDRIFR